MACSSPEPDHDLDGGKQQLAEAFDYLLVDGTARRPFRAPTDLLGERLHHLDQLSDADSTALIHIIDGLLANTRVRAALTGWRDPGSPDDAGAC